MVIDKKHGVLITDEGLANLLHIEVKRANEKANDIKIQRIVCDTQAIDLNGDLKNENRGGRRYSINCYDLHSALALVSATTNLNGAKTTGLADILTRAWYCRRRNRHQSLPGKT